MKEPENHIKDTDIAATGGGTHWEPDVIHAQQVCSGGKTHSLEGT